MESSVAGFDERKPRLVRSIRESIQEESGCVGFCLRGDYCNDLEEVPGEKEIHKNYLSSLFCTLSF